MVLFKTGISLLTLIYLMCTTLTRSQGTSEEDNPNGELPFNCQSEGFFPDPVDCSVFYRCIYWGESTNDNSVLTRITPFKFQCQLGTVYDRESYKCIPISYSTLQKCQLKNEEEQLISLPRSDLENHNANNFDYGIIQAVHSDKAQPQPSFFGKSESTNQLEPLNDADNSINDQPHRQTRSPPCNSEGFFPIEGDCIHFYRCVGNGPGFNKYEFACSEGTVWDPDNNACNHAWAVNRPDCKVDNSGGNNGSPEGVGSEYNPEVDNPGPDYGIGYPNQGQGGYPNQGQGGQPNQEQGYPAQKPTAPTDPNAFTSEPEQNLPSSSQRPSNSSPSTKQPTDNSSMPTTKKPNGNKNITAGNGTCINEGFQGVKENCRKFIRCVRNNKGGLNKYEFECAEGTVWDTEEETCNYPDVVQRSDCKNQTSTNQVPPTNGESNNSNTESGTSSNQPPTSSNQSNYGNNNQQPSSTSSSYPSLTSNPGQFSSSKPSTQGQQIASSSETSNPEEQNSPSTNNNSPGGESNTKPSNNDQCTEEGFFPSSTDCTKFYRCVKNEGSGFLKYEFDCGPGTVYDPQNTACNHPSVVQNDKCQGNSNGNTPQSSTPPIPEETTSSSSTISAPTKTTTSKNTLSTTKPNKGSSSKPQTAATTKKPSQTTPFEPTIKPTQSNKENNTKPVTSAKPPTATSKPTTSKPGSDNKPPTTKPTQSSNKNNTTPVTSVKPPLTSSKPTTTKPGSDNKPTTKPSQSNNKNNTTPVTSVKPSLPSSKPTTAKPGNKPTTKPTQSNNKNNTTPVTNAKPSSTTSKPTTTKPGSTNDPGADSTTEQSSTNAQTEFPEKNSTEPASSPKINCTKAGFYPHPDDCKKFYRCVDWDGDQGERFSVYYFDCPDGTIFDPSLDTCNHAESVYPQRECNNTSDSLPQVSTDFPSNTTDSTANPEEVQNSTPAESSTHSTDALTETPTTTLLEPSTQPNINDNTTAPSSTSGTTPSTTDVTTLPNEMTTELSSTVSGSTQPSSEGSTQPSESSTQPSEGSTQPSESSTQPSEGSTQPSDSSTQPPEGSTQPSESTTQPSEGSTQSSESTTNAITTTQITEESTAAANQATTTSNPIESGTTPIQENDNQTCLNLKPDQFAIVCPAGFRRHPKFCNLFYQCTISPRNEIKVLTLSCVEGTVYDEDKVQCLPQNQAKKCDGMISNARNIKANVDSPITVKSDRSICPNEGTYSYKEDCRLFYKCRKNEEEKLNGFLYQCPDGYAYWNISKRCEKEEKVPCDSGRRVSGKPTLAPVETRNVGFK